MKWMMPVGVLSVVIAANAWADQFSGRFANEVVFINYQGDGALDDALGPPDGSASSMRDVDLDRGAITVRFGETTEFDYGWAVAIPAGTDVLITEGTGAANGPYPAVWFGSSAAPTDANGDGIADEAVYAGRVLGYVFYPEGSAPWTPWAQRLLFIDLSCGDQIMRSPSEFVLAIDDLPGGDFNLNAVQWVQCHGCVGDLNCDRSVELNDLTLLLSYFGSCEGDDTWFAPADVDCRGCVDLADLSILLAHFGEICQ